MKNGNGVAAKAKPGRGRCCICEKSVDPAERVVERRATGEDFAVEEWAYCMPCWLSMEVMRRKGLRIGQLLNALEGQS